MDDKNNVMNGDPPVESPTSVLEEEVFVFLYLSVAIL
jgi:hypothetical protein